MNIVADRDRRQRNGATRGRDLYWGFTIAIFSNLVTLFIISQGGDLPSLAISVMVLATFIFVMINFIVDITYYFIDPRIRIKDEMS